MKIFLITVVSGVIFAHIMRAVLIPIIRKQRSKGWKPGDVLILEQVHTSLELYRETKKGNGKPVLAGWNRHNVFINVGDMTYTENWNAIEANKSDIWRKHYYSCNSYMGVKPNFSPVVNSDITESSSDMVDGQSISTLNETMCQIYLKQALESENYELAEMLKKRLENFK